MSASWWLSSRSVFSPRLFQGLLFFRGKFATQLFFVSDLVLQRVGVAFQLVSGVNALLELLSPSANFSASLTILPISSGVRPFWSLVIVPSTFVFSCHTWNTVHVYLKGNFNPWHPTGSRRNSSQIKRAQEVIVFGQQSFTFIDLDCDSWLIVGSRRKDLRLLGGHYSIPWNQFGHHISHILSAKGKRTHVKQHQMPCVLITREHPSLHSSTVHHGLGEADAAQ